MVEPPSTAAVQKSQSQFFLLKNMFVSMSVTIVFLHVVSKVSRAIAQMDIYRNVRILEGTLVTDYNNIAYIQPIYDVVFNIYRKIIIW